MVRTCRAAEAQWSRRSILLLAWFDEMVISIVKLILGGGARLFGGLGARPKLEQLQVVDAPGVTHIRYALAR